MNNYGVIIYYVRRIERQLHILTPAIIMLGIERNINRKKYLQCHEAPPPVR